jgi:hypothetical protein
VVKAFDIANVLSSLPTCQTIVLTGQKAIDTLSSVLLLKQQPKI